jgi:DNA-binding NarL/FixJ family response regulator
VARFLLDAGHGSYRFAVQTALTYANAIFPRQHIDTSAPALQPPGIRTFDRLVRTLDSRTRLHNGGRRGVHRMKVLIADDHPVVRQGLKQILATQPDMEVAGEAQNAEETLALAHRLEWDVAVVDYSMPDGTALEIVKRMKRAFPGRPVLVLSIHPEDQIALGLLRAGAAGYISKESASEELTTAIRKAVSGSKYVSSSLAERLAVEMERGRGVPPHERLSDREYRVMWLLANGQPIRGIAQQLCVSPNTVSTYRLRILKKLKLASNAELVRYAIKHRLTQ